MLVYGWVKKAVVVAYRTMDKMIKMNKFEWETMEALPDLHTGKKIRILYFT